MFWRATVLPLVERTAKAFAAWLSPAWGAPLTLKPDIDAIEALSGERKALWKRLEGASFLTIDEKRAAIGYGPMEGGAQSKYNPDQPRVPAGTSGGGQWTDGDAISGGSGSDELGGGGSGENARGPLRWANDAPVDLEEEDRNYGGHSFKRHVARTDEDLLSALRRDRYDGPTISITRKALGSFLLKEDANDLVNRVLEENTEDVARVVAGEIATAKLIMRFGSVTGKEAFRSDAYSEPYVRPTYEVYVEIDHDDRSAKKFRVYTAYPRNEWSKK